MRPSALIIAASLLAVPLTGCTAPNDPSDPIGPGEVAFETLEAGQNSGITDQRTVVIRDQAAFGELMAEHRAGEPATEALEADLSEVTVIGVFQGIQANTCYGAGIDRIERLADSMGLVIHGFWVVPGQGAVCGEALTSPYHIVTIPATDAEVNFQMETLEGPGGNGTDDEEQPPDNATVPARDLEGAGSLRVEDRQEVVIRDNATWQAFWSNHTGHRSDPGNAPAVDFQHRMILGVFKGQSPDGCHRAAITDVTQADNGSYVVDGAYHKIGSGGCTLAITYPMHVVTVPTSPEPVVFRMSEGNPDQGEDGGDGSRARLVQETIDQGSRSGVEERRTVVIRDQATWEALWANHTADEQDPEPAPDVNFSEKMVLAAFKGTSPDACHGVEIEGVYQADNGSAWEVQGAFYQVQGQPCAEVITHPFHIVEVTATDDPVTWAMEEETRQA